MDIFTKLKQLPLQPHEFIVTGSGILAALNIRPANDIDLLVTTEAFAELKDQGWKFEVVTAAGIPREKVSHDLFEAFHDFKVSGFTQDIRIGHFKPTVINGINFLPLAVVREIKLQMNRDKDRHDLTLIETYLDTTSLTQ